MQNRMVFVSEPLDASCSQWVEEKMTVLALSENFCLELGCYDSCFTI